MVSYRKCAEIYNLLQINTVPLAGDRRYVHSRRGRRGGGYGEREVDKCILRSIEWMTKWGEWLNANTIACGTEGWWFGSTPNVDTSFCIPPRACLVYSVRACFERVILKDRRTSLTDRDAFPTVHHLSPVTYPLHTPCTYRRLPAKGTICY